MAKLTDIVNAARQLLGAPYRTWQEGNSIPMWLDDGVSNPPSVAHLHSVGVNSSDLINWALEVNGFPAGGGTGTFVDHLVNTANFDPYSPGRLGG
jgi:hypothetical protein